MAGLSVSRRIVLPALGERHLARKASGHVVQLACTCAARLSVLLLLVAIRAYQVLVRPHLVGACKFFPSCSDYAAEALRTYGLLRGTWLAIRRLLRCHPFGPGGLDPVPDKPLPDAKRLPR